MHRARKRRRRGLSASHAKFETEIGIRARKRRVLPRLGPKCVPALSPSVHGLVTAVFVAAAAAGALPRPSRPARCVKEEADCSL